MLFCFPFTTGTILRWLFASYRVLVLGRSFSFSFSFYFSFSFSFSFTFSLLTTRLLVSLPLVTTPVLSFPASFPLLAGLLLGLSVSFPLLTGLVFCLAGDLARALLFYERSSYYLMVTAFLVLATGLTKPSGC